MVPDLVDIGGPWKVLPPGVHDATMEEIEARFATTDRRRTLFSGFKDGTFVLRKAGCRTIFLNGSFVTDKLVPGDFDACWDSLGVDSAKLDPVLLDFSNAREKQKERFKGEFFPASSTAHSLTPADAPLGSSMPYFSRRSLSE